MCKDNNLVVKEHAYKEGGENSQRRGKASDLTKSQNVLKGTATHTQFNNHVTSDVNRHLSGNQLLHLCIRIHLNQLRVPQRSNH